jgi:hypothetical protein
MDSETSEADIVDTETEDEGYDDEAKDDDDSIERELAEFEDEYEAVSSTASIVPQLSSMGDCAAEPQLLIANDALRHFWGHFFPQQAYVRWATFLAKLEEHLAATRETPLEGAGRYPTSPAGYGLHRWELLTLFKERPGKRHLMRSLRYALDLECAGMVSVYQLALLVKPVLPASMPLKLLLFYLANMGGKILLPATLYPAANAVALAAQVRASFKLAVLAEKEYAVQSAYAVQQEAVAVEGAVPLAQLFSPYTEAQANLQGPDSLRDSMEKFLRSARKAGGKGFLFHVVAAPSGQGTTTRVIAAVKAQLHRALERSHSLMCLAAVKGGLSVWDLTHSGDIKTSRPSSIELTKDHNFYSNSKTGSQAVGVAKQTVHGEQLVAYSSRDVADDSFPFAGLFDAIYVDLRGRSNKGDVLAAFSCQLALRGSDDCLGKHSYLMLLCCYAVMLLCIKPTSSMSICYNYLLTLSIPYTPIHPYTHTAYQVAS